MFRKAAVMVAALMLMGSEEGLCGEQTDGAVTGLLPSQASFSFIASGARSSSPVCATAANYWSVDLSTAQGQAISASVVTAFATGKTINVCGTGSCSTSAPDRETVLYVFAR